MAIQWGDGLLPNDAPPEEEEEGETFAVLDGLEAMECQTEGRHCQSCEDLRHVRLHGFKMLSEELPTGRKLLASFDVRFAGLCVKDTVLMVDIEGKYKLSPPRAKGRRGNTRTALQFKSKGLRDNITKTALAEYRRRLNTKGNTDD